MSIFVCWLACEQYTQWPVNRVIDGKAVGEAEYPWMVLQFRLNFQ